MKAGDMLELAARNLRESLLRSSLTTLGVAVGVASLVAMLSLGVGLQNLASDRVQGSGLLNTIGVYSRRDISSFDRAERRANPRTESARPLDDAARAEMERLPGVLEVFPEIRFETEVRYNGRSYFSRVAGLPLSSRENEAFDSLQGQFFSGPEAAEAILQLEFAQQLANPASGLVGQEIVFRYPERQPLNSAGEAGADGDGPGDSGGGEWGFSIVRRERPFRVVGVIEQEPFGGWRNFARGSVFIPNALAEEMNTLQPSSLRDAVRAEERPTYPSLIVRVRGVSDVEPVQRAIRGMGFTAWSILDAESRLRQFFVIVDLFLGIFGSLALAVASLGVVNTLVMAILERRREIGILKALGASDRDVKRLFFTEAGVMGLAGGVLGVTIGWAIGQAINLGTNFYLQEQGFPPETIVGVPWWLAGGAVGFAVLVSLVSGLYPAARAAKLDPVQALRYE